MKSKWSHLKPRAIQLRKQGKSLPYIHTTLHIPKSTLSYWMKDVLLTESQKAKLHQNWKDALVKARRGAAKWHNQQKADRLAVAKTQAIHTLKNVDLKDPAILELSLAVLYLAEGYKKNPETGLGSSDPVTLRFFLKGIETIFDYDASSVRCELYLRADQDPLTLKKYWAKELSLPLKNFKQVHNDQRSAGKPTYETYKGVCSLRCGNIAIRRRLVFLAEEYFAIIGTQKRA